ncbi:MAG: class I SAM-dependent methyltransferase [Saprospiraceae bacterium]|nr:class I SAM-dependent methyltransferase [Saprospiraceae bacterium]MCF8250898.1 class I SAM-dependent methyltransferase [Saprospiraceae bacterium]MCF8282715.1 class I SAM-dependent methyltransferase [Bacteroidales bacterium]MCF8311863.1 class I SAM-dependent methyltransferase [Saprospiraceae bacterium]MCF8443023.1 class I SAM-dependent methyltransferase [Saprospiraceae bacterium]
MTFLDKNFPIDNPDTVLLFEELSLWSSYFGKLLLDHVPLRKGISVLDVGCGPGFPLFELANRMDASCKITGIDPWEAAVERARWKKSHHQLLPAVEIVLGDAAKMPFPDQSFDLVTANLGINNFDDPAATIRACHRVLKKDGRLCLTTNLEGHFREFYVAFETTLRELGLDEHLPKLKAQEQHRGTDETVRDLLEDAHFNVLKIVRDKFQMRYVSGTAFFNHFLTVIGFLPGWRNIVPAEAEVKVFAHLEKKLNEQADWDGELKMTVPMLYVEAVK